MLEVVSLRPCRGPGCQRHVVPGDSYYPFCSGRCSARAAELQNEAIRVLPVRAGEVIAQECRGGGVVSKPAPYEGLSICKGDGPPLLVPRAAIQAALDILDGRSRGRNGHGRKYGPAEPAAQTASQEADAMSNEPEQQEEPKAEEKKGDAPPAESPKEEEQPNDGPKKAEE